MTRVQAHAEQVMGERLAPAAVEAPAEAVELEPAPTVNPLEALPEPGDAPCCH